MMSTSSRIEGRRRISRQVAEFQESTEGRGILVGGVNLLGSRVPKAMTFELYKTVGATESNDKG